MGLLLDRAGGSGARRASGFAGIDVTAVASAWAVIDIRERSVEVSFGLHQIRRPVAGQIRVDIVYVHSIAQDVIGKNGTTCGVTHAALVPGQDPSHGNT